ncbi:hypothetical protein NQ318_015834 [Aromia moschata]|uniref:Delta-like protein n=1 Tax=Aromia moschata TaxID=1265417 RepID=A0AAV8YQP5_9CUCU|nr:hypothetical protein NQ318_015834 [Aromia moschata]
MLDRGRGIFIETNTTTVTFTMSWILVRLVLGLSLALHQAESSGVFELRLISFDNEAGKDDLGKCCTGKTKSNNECDGVCRPRFRVCLKEYQVKIDTTSPCTFGDVITSELGPNPVTDTPQNGFSNSIAFPFPFTWPGTFSLIVEAWHGNQTSHSAVLVSRLMTQRWLEVGDNWTEDSHSSKYSTLRFEYRVTCDPNYYGKGCENLCRPRDDRFGHYSCSPMGGASLLSRMDGRLLLQTKSNATQCLPGCDEQHGHCTVPNECKRCDPSLKSPDGGSRRELPYFIRHCGPYNFPEVRSRISLVIRSQTRERPAVSRRVLDIEGRCQSGWEGTLCNQCQRYPGCMHGTCVKPWDCLCDEGWGGLFCNQDLNFCTNHKPCRNGGTCFNTGQGSYTCSCSAGFNGTDCEIPTDDCSRSPCLNGGGCVPKGAYNVCSCPFGFSGLRCEVSTKTCAEQPCKNGGTCTNTDVGYQCSCRPGFSGADCEHQANSCAPNPCKNDGTCVESASGFQCICPSGFAGDRCEVNKDDCQGNPCLNGGTCIDKVNEFRCHCVPGYVGPLCERRVDYCHGGTCERRVHGFECTCPPGFLGSRCEEVSSSAAPSARVSSESNLTTEHIVVIATISTFVPLVVLVAVGVIVCLKQRRKREKARADEEARLQNEQNTANSSFAKRGAAISADPHVIKNSWGKCTNNVISSNLSSPDDCSVPVYSLQRTRSQKQLNTETGARASALLAAKLHEPEYEHIKRLSVMSNASAVCASSDPSLLKRPVEKESNGVYVIEEHFHVPDAISSGLFATEV